MKLELVENPPPLTGAVMPRLHTPWVGGQSKVDAIIELADLKQQKEKKEFEQKKDSGKLKGL